MAKIINLLEKILEKEEALPNTSDTKEVPLSTQLKNWKRKILIKQIIRNYKRKGLY